MKTCPFCKEDVHDDASKCRYCHSLLPTASIAAPTAMHALDPDKHATYVFDRDLIRFGKFAGAVLAVFLVVGSYLFGFKLESSVQKIAELHKDVEAASADLQQSQDELRKAKATVAAMESDVQAVLQEARATLDEIKKERTEAVAMVVSIQELDSHQKLALSRIAKAQPERLRGNTRYWPVGATVRIGFLGGREADRAFVRRTAVEWLKYANLHFEFVDSADADVHVAFKPEHGSWSFIGTDVLGVPHDQPTLSLGRVDRRTVLHEFGHVLGLIEEHQHPGATLDWDVAALKRELGGPPYHWSEEVIAEKMLKKVPQEQLAGYRPYDPKSIMAVRFGQHAQGEHGSGDGELSIGDQRFAAQLYPADVATAAEEAVAADSAAH